MDHATEMSQRLRQYASTLSASNARHADDYAIEEWLGFWDEDDSTFGNIRNIEHWLQQAVRRPARG